MTSTGKKRRETNDKKVAKKKNGFKEDMEKDEKKSVGTYISIFILVRIWKCILVKISIIFK